MGNKYGIPFPAMLLAGILVVVGGWRQLHGLGPLSPYALVSDKVLAAPRNLPPVLNDATVSLSDIDGNSITWVTPGFLQDRALEARIGPGQHLFHVKVSPLLRGPHEIPRDVKFFASVEAGKEYFIESKGAFIGLVEARQRSNWRVAAFRQNPARFARVDDSRYFMVISLDGGPTDREEPHFWQNQRRSTIVDPGQHRFEVKVLRSGPGPDDRSRHLIVEATFEAGRSYRVVSKKGLVALEGTP